MSKTDTMAKLPGLFQRAGVWTLRVMIPLDLQGAYQGRAKVLESLHTTDNAEAKLKGTARGAEWLATFANKRRELNPQPLGAVTPELSKALAQRVAAAVLRTDDNVRGNPATAQLFVDTLRPFRTPGGLTIPTEAPSPTARRAAPPASPLQGLSSELSAELSAINAYMGVHGATQLATQRIASVLPLVKAEARALGMEFDERAPGAVDALRESLKAYRKALHDIGKRDDGEVIDTPSVHSRMAPASAKLDKLRDVLPQWKASKARKPQTVQAAEKALALYEQCTGNPPIASLTRTQGVDMRAFLLAGGVTAKTARDRFDYIKGFLNFASRELEVLPRNPWAGLAIEYTTTTPRRPWSSEQLAAYFARPLHVAYNLPSTWEAGADAAYWVPLLGIFTGARISELCQLRTADVSTVDGVHVLYITNESEGQNVKTVAARRVVPIHTELVRLGFMGFVDAIRAAGMFNCSRRCLCTSRRRANTSPSGSELHACRRTDRGSPTSTHCGTPCGANWHLQASPSPSSTP
jgi:integrase